MLVACLLAVVGWYICGAIGAWMYVRSAGDTADFRSFRELFLWGAIGMTGMWFVSLFVLWIRIIQSPVWRLAGTPFRRISDFFDDMMNELFLWLKAK
jgi:hypothetical protein